MHARTHARYCPWFLRHRRRKFLIPGRRQYVTVKPMALALVAEVSHLQPKSFSAKLKIRKRPLYAVGELGGNVANCCQVRGAAASSLSAMSRAANLQPHYIAIIVLPSTQNRFHICSNIHSVQSCVKVSAECMVKTFACC